MHDRFYDIDVGCISLFGRWREPRSLRSAVVASTVGGFRIFDGIGTIRTIRNKRTGPCDR
ncbi:MAG: hypothetical protein NTAFB01_29840 [Nitrospira sp.]